MKKIDLEEPRFVQADGIAIVPNLKAKTLQNWNDLKLIKPENANPGRQGKRLYSGVALVYLAIALEIVRVGIKPGVALKMANWFKPHILDLHHNHPAQQIGDRLVWTFRSAEPDEYRRAYIFADDQYWIEFEEKARMVRLTEKSVDVDFMRHIWPPVYVTLEFDRLVFAVFNRLYSQLADVDVLSPSREPMG